VKKLDNWFKKARVVAENSPDEETQVGCLIIDPETGIEVSSGFNGFIRKGPDTLPKKRPDKHTYIIHSETNALLNACYIGAKTRNCVAIVTLSPCITCMRNLYQAGVKTIYFHDEYKDFNNQLNMLDLVIDVEEVGIFKKITLSPKIVS